MVEFGEILKYFVAISIENNISKKNLLIDSMKMRIELAKSLIRCYNLNLLDNLDFSCKTIKIVDG